MDPLFGTALTAGRARDLMRAWDAADVGTRLGLERIGPLVAAALAATGELALCPDDLQAVLKNAARESAALELAQHRELLQMVARLEAAGVRPVLFKGAALAYTLYVDPALRPREDTDLLIGESEYGAVEGALNGLGYQRAAETHGRWITQQVHFERTVAGIRHAVDVHFSPFNPQVFTGVLAIDEVRRDAVSMSRIPGALAPSRVHSLLIAAVHRIAHHDGADELLWLYDLRLLCADAPRDTFEELVDLASARGVAAITAAALSAAVDRLGAAVPRTIVRRLNERGRREVSARYLDANLRPSDVLMIDLRALPGWRARIEAIGQHLFPPRAYIASKYRLRSEVAISLAYIRRIARGASGWLARPSAASDRRFRDQ